MYSCRIHIFGASGAGVTTLGRALADQLAVPHHDVDDYYWCPTVPPYQVKRPIPDRLRLMTEMFTARADWVLSGALDSWGNDLVPLFDLVVFLTAPAELRVDRLRNRDARQFGAEAMGPGGWRHQETQEFLEWASHYDDGSREGRSLPRHEAWLKTLPCPVLRADGRRLTADLVQDVLTFRATA